MDELLQKTVRRFKNLAIFKDIPDEALGELLVNVEERDYAKDQVLVPKGSGGDELYLIRSGWAKISSDAPDGAELVVNHIGPGQAIGDISLIDGQAYNVTVTAMMPVKVLALQRADFLVWMDRYPRLALEIMRGLSEKIRMSTAYVQKAIDWSNKVAGGDYAPAMEQVSTEHTMVTTSGRPDEVMVGEFLAAFHAMLEGVKNREDNLRNEIQQLSIKLDSGKVEKEVDQLTETSFFQGLKAARDKLRGGKSGG